MALPTETLNGNSVNGNEKSGVIPAGDRPKRRFTWGQCLKYEVDSGGEFIKKIHSLPKKCTDTTLKASPIQEFFADCNVLITGATGFLGKILFEKLLVSCPNIGKIYLIIRNKKGKSCDERFDELFKDEVFKRLHEMVPNFRQKIIAVNGDCSQSNLGLTPKDYDYLSKNIHVIFHVAATVRFDEKIRIATNINIRGVREILTFSRKCLNLKSIVHVSTAYSNSTTLHEEINETFYPPAYNYEKLFKMVDNETDETLDKITNSLIAPWPNTYSFTKQIAEDVVRQEGQGLPISIFRPAIVIATYQEPVRGWCDNVFGPTGIIVGVGTGVLRVMQVYKEATANIVPVDYSVNALIAAAWKTHQDFKKNAPPKIYNYVSSARNPISWGEFSYWAGLYGRMWPSMLSIWYPMCMLTSSRFLYLITAFFIHTVPAYLADALLYLLGKEPKLIKGYRKINKFLEVIAYFGFYYWKFTDNNVLKLWNELDKDDQEIFPFDIENVDWDYHSQAHILGLRVYLVKDPLETLPAAKIKYKRLIIQHTLTVASVGFLLLWMVVKLLGWKL